MPSIVIDGNKLSYEDTGPGSSGETIVFSPGLLWGTAQFAPQVAALRQRYRCICYDHPGQGASADVAYDTVPMETVYLAAARLILALDLGPVHFCGLSMGGWVGLRLAVSRPDLLRSLILIATSARAERPIARWRYRTMNQIFRLLGAGWVVDRVMAVMIGGATRTDPARKPDVAMWRQMLLSQRRSTWRAVRGVIERQGLDSEVQKVSTPTLIIAGGDDTATPPAESEALNQAIDGSRLVLIARAGHTPTLEQPDTVSQAIAAFLDELSERLDAPASLGRRPGSLAQ